MNVIAKSRARVPSHTSEAVNEEIRRKTERSIRYFSEHPERVNERLDEIADEWDIERVLETWSSLLTLGGLSLSALRSRKFLALPIIVQLFFLQHAVQGWCPPLRILRRLGVRTAEEIEIERLALQSLRRHPEHARAAGTVNLLEMLDESSEAWH